MEVVGETVLPPSPMRAVLWTNKLGYASGGQFRVYATLDGMGDTRPYLIDLD